MIKMKRICAVMLICVCLFGIVVSADNSAYTNSFTVNETASGEKTVYMPDVYRASATVRVRDLGLTEGFEKFRDIDCDDEGNTYILADPGRILVLDKDLKLLKDMMPHTSDGDELDVNGAQGIYVTDSNVFIADTENARVLLCDKNAVVLKEITVPDSSLIPSDFTFRPMKVSMDSHGYLYVLSDGSYYGALLYDTDGVFSGFYGANAVNASVLTALQNLWDMLVQNDVKRSKTKRTLPFQFLDLYVDENDFVYTCTGQTSGNKKGQIRKLSTGGSNILSKVQKDGTHVASDSYNFAENTTLTRLKQSVQQNFISVLVDERGFIYALDSTYGLIYIYDQQCSLISVFGGGYGKGEQRGVFSEACAMAFNGSGLIVADSLRDTVTVWNLTDFGDILLEAQSKTLDADYAAAEPLWNQVIKSDAGNQLAQCGLAKSAFVNGDYRTAMKLARLGRDSTTYGQALEKVSDEFISDNFIWLFPAILLFVGGVVALLIISKKRRLVLVSNQKIRLMFGSIFHPFYSFQEIKYKKQSSLLAASVITFLLFVTGALQTTVSDFRFTSYDPTTYNLLYQLARTAGMLLLCSLVNWGVAALTQGKGTLKEVIVVMGYSMIPIVFYQTISIPLSYIITSPQSLIITALQIAAVILTGIMLCVGLMTVHDYSFPKLVFVAILTVLGMILVIFIVFVILMLLSQFRMFIVTVFMEAAYR